MSASTTRIRPTSGKGREYSTLDCTTAWGTPADDAYRNSEADTFRQFRNSVIQRGIDPIDIDRLLVKLTKARKA